MRPLLVEELRDALAIMPSLDCTSIKKLRLHQGWSDTLIDFERYVKHVSRGLVQFQSQEMSIEGNTQTHREAVLTHQSVADHLKCSVFKNKGYVNAQSYISSCLLRYLTLEAVFQTSQYPHEPNDTGTERSDLQFPLRVYASKFIFENVIEAGGMGILQSDLIGIFAISCVTSNCLPLLVATNRSWLQRHCENLTSLRAFDRRMESQWR
jgi:hypothetical protein